MPFFDRSVPKLILGMNFSAGVCPNSSLALSFRLECAETRQWHEFVDKGVPKLVLGIHFSIGLCQNQVLPVFPPAIFRPGGPKSTQILFYHFSPGHLPSGGAKSAQIVFLRRLGSVWGGSSIERVPEEATDPKLLILYRKTFLPLLGAQLCCPKHVFRRLWPPGGNAKGRKSSRKHAFGSKPSPNRPISGLSIEFWVKI